MILFGPSVKVFANPGQFLDFGITFKLCLEFSLVAGFSTRCSVKVMLQHMGLRKDIYTTFTKEKRSFGHGLYVLPEARHCIYQESSGLHISSEAPEQ